MCGIVGYFGPKDVDLKRAAQTILHRGPDMQGITSGAGWTVAFNRLSIIDTSENGMQPLQPLSLFGSLSQGFLFLFRLLQVPFLLQQL